MRQRWFEFSECPRRRRTRAQSAALAIAQRIACATFFHQRIVVTATVTSSSSNRAGHTHGRRRHKRRHARMRLRATEALVDQRRDHLAPAPTGLPGSLGVRARQHSNAPGSGMQSATTFPWPDRERASGRSPDDQLEPAPAPPNWRGECGPGPADLYNDDGTSAVVTDFFRRDSLRCGQTRRRLYLTLVTGLDGTPMASHAETPAGTDAWDLKCDPNDHSHRDGWRIECGLAFKASGGPPRSTRGGARRRPASRGCRRRPRLWPTEPCVRRGTR